MLIEVYTCSGCLRELPRSQFHEFKVDLRKRPVTSKCRECRKNDYYRRRYDTVCICCQKHRPLNNNAQCKKCNADAGLRECNKCENLLPLFLSFYGNSSTCKNCLKNT